MATRVQRRRGTTVEHSTFTGAVGETTVDTTKDTVVVHDAVTAGGHPLAKEARAINTTAPITGGGTLAADRTLAISNNGITNALLAQMAANTIKGNNTGGASDPLDLTATQITAMLNNFTSALKGLVPLSGGGTSNFLRADGSWAVPPGSAADQDSFNVDDYGADNTGVANSTTAIRAAITAAAANVTATGRRSAVTFSAGEYLVTTRTSLSHFDITGMTNLVFQGASGMRTMLNFSGDAAAGDWYMFHVHGGSTDIEFRNLKMDMAGLTNPDPAEQNHLIQIGNNASDVWISDCEFLNTVGDGIRLLGEFAAPVENVFIKNCKFDDCGRAGVSFQRWTRFVDVSRCRFDGGDDQQIDFEATGYQLVADAGGSATILQDASASFVSWGIVPGDIIYHYGDEQFFTVASVDSATQLTIDAGATTWASADYYFPKHCEGIHIHHNFLNRVAPAVDLLATFYATYKSSFSDNTLIGGGLKVADAVYSAIERNSIETAETGLAEAGIGTIKVMTGTRIDGNIIVVRNTTNVIGRNGISVAAQVRTPGDISISGNTIFQLVRGNAIKVDSAATIQIDNNFLVLYTPGDTNLSGAIDVRAISRDIDSVQANNNKIRIMAGSGNWQYGFRASASPNDVHSITVRGGFMADCTNPIDIGVSGGVISTPPFVDGISFEDGASPIVPTASVPWFQIAGLNGRAAGKRYMPGIFWGNDSPEGVLYGAMGSKAYCRNADGVTIHYTYEKQTDTNLSTGWVALISGGSGSPGGSSGQVQWNNAAAFAGATNVNVDSGDLHLDDNASPATPAGGTKLVSAAVAGRSVLAMLSALGIQEQLGTDWGRARRALYLAAGNSNQAAILGLNTPTVVGTATSRITNYGAAGTRKTRLGFVSAAGAGSMTSVRHTATFFTIGDGTDEGGFRFWGEVMCSDAATVAGARGFFGVHSNTAAATNVDPATLTNCIGLAQLAGSGNMHIVYGGSAAQTPIDLGANFPAGTLSVDYYELELFAPRNSNNTVYYKVTRVNTGDVATGTLTGTAGTALPSATTGLTWNCWRTNNATALAAGFDVGQIIVEYY